MDGVWVVSKVDSCQDGMMQVAMELSGSAQYGKEQKSG